MFNLKQQMEEVSERQNNWTWNKENGKIMDVHGKINEFKINFCHDHSTFSYILCIWESNVNKKTCKYNDNQWSEDVSKVAHIQIIFTKEVNADYRWETLTITEFKLLH